MNKQQNALTKRCTRCQVEKPWTEFYTISRAHCKECEKEQKAQYHASLRGKAYRALNASQQARSKSEQETGRTIKDDLSIYQVMFTLGESECSYCGRKISESERTLDHIVSMRHGGHNSFYNVVMACKRCNSVKSDSPVLAHMLREVQDDVQFIRLIDRMSQRKCQSIAETLKELSDASNTYYSERAAKEIQKAREQAD